MQGDPSEGGSELVELGCRAVRHTSLVGSDSKEDHGVTRLLGGGMESISGLAPGKGPEKPRCWLRRWCTRRKDTGSQGQLFEQRGCIIGCMWISRMFSQDPSQQGRAGRGMQQNWWHQVTSSKMATGGGRGTDRGAATLAHP